MIFVDGENLAIRYGKELGGNTPMSHVVFVPNVFVWSPHLSRRDGPYDFIRRYYYTSAPGAENDRDPIAQRLRDSGIEAPRVFPRTKDRGSKRVDITLATEMLTHAHRGHFDFAILVAGDEDYVPLVEAVKGEGRRVALWFLENGLSPALKAAADHYWNIGDCLFNGPEKEPAFIALYG
jgi:uncharacterized LabA/DUF88 family protein